MPMTFFNNEKVLWESENKTFCLTTHRLRELSRSFWGSRIKSILLEDLEFCEMQTHRAFRFLVKAVVYFILINGFVYLFNKFLADATLVKIFIGETYLGPSVVAGFFYVSLIIALGFIGLFFLSLRKTYLFYSSNQVISFQPPAKSFEQHEAFITMVERAKAEREKDL